MKVYPYQDLELADRTNENWKDISGLEGMYQISDQGRIKRLKRQWKDKNGHLHSRSEMIITQTPAKSFNAYTGDYKCYLRVALTVNGKVHNISVPRMVYNTFVAEINLSDRNLFVFPIDGDTMNAAHNNLVAGNQKDKQKRMESAGRRGTPFLDITPEKRQATQEKINATRAKKNADRISRYSLSGKLLETYHNAVIAAKAFNSNANLLSKATRGKPLTYKGYVWRRGSEKEIDLSHLNGISGICYSPLSKFVKRIGQYNMNGELISTFGTVKEAAQALHLTYSNLSDALNDRHLTCGGFIWRYSTKNKINLKNLKTHSGYTHSPLSAEDRKISRYDFNGIWQQTYDHISDASRKTGVNTKSISMVIKGKAITAGGFLWQKGQNLRINPHTFKNFPGFDNSPLGRFYKKRRSNNSQPAVAV